jgi:hypothetical protein
VGWYDKKSQEEQEKEKVSRSATMFENLSHFCSHTYTHTTYTRSIYLNPTSPTPFVFIFSEDVMFNISSFLKPIELCTLMYQCSRYMGDHFRQSGEESAWCAQLFRDYYSYYKDKFPPPSNFISSFPTNGNTFPKGRGLAAGGVMGGEGGEGGMEGGGGGLLAEGTSSSFDTYLRLYTKKLEQQYYQVVSLKALHIRMSNFIKDRSSKKGQELVGCIFDLIKIENPDIARAIAIRRQRAMKTVIVRTGNAFMEFRRKEPNSRPLSFLPLDMSFDTIAPGPLDLPLQVGKIEGFRGYAIDLIDLRPEHQHLRMR